MDSQYDNFAKNANPKIKCPRQEIPENVVDKALGNSVEFAVTNGFDEFSGCCL